MTDHQDTAWQTMLEDMAGKDMAWEHLSLVLEAAPQLLAPQLRWGSKRLPLLSMLVDQVYRRPSRDYPSPALLDQVLAANPGALEATDARGKNAVHAMFSAFGQCGGSSGLAWWLRHAPMALLLAFRTTDSYSNPEPGADVYRLVMESERACRLRPGEPSLLTLLFERGLDPNLYLKGGRFPVCARMLIPAQWGAFLAHGGNPDLPVQRGDGPAMPLWKFLLANEPALTTAMETWAANNRSDTLAQKKLDDYWKTLVTKSTGYVRSAEVGGLLKSHPDWPTLVDEQGRNPAMFAITMADSAWRTLEQKGYAHMLGTRDHQGRSLWNYALGNPTRLEGGTYGFLAKQGISADPSPITGRGLLADMVLHKSRDTGLFSDHLEVPPPASWKTLFAKTTAEQWFAVGQEELGGLVSALLAQDWSRLGEFTEALLKAFPEASLPAPLKGAFAVILLVPNRAMAMALMEDGGQVSPRDVLRVRQAMVNKQLPGYADELLAKAEANALLAQTAPASGISRNAGPRL